MLKSAIKNTAIHQRHELTDEEVFEVVVREAKRRRESIEMFRTGGRNDLVGREEEQLKIIEKYLPAQLSEAELQTITQEVIQSLKATAKDFGRVMSAVMGRVKGQADGHRVSTMVKTLLR